MSARPEPKSLQVQDLDLLLSRSLDGDLSPEEERELAEVLAQDPQARRRRDEMASLVTDLKRLPSAGAPFALATRVSANALEQARSAGSIWHRFGLYPPPGAALGAVGVLAIVLLAIPFLRERDAAFGPSAAPVQVAEQRAEEAGPVDVFFSGEDEAGEKKAKAEAQPASQPPSGLSKDSRAASPASPAEAPASEPAAVLAEARPGRDSLSRKGDVAAEREDSKERMKAERDAPPSAVPDRAVTPDDPGAGAPAGVGKPSARTNEESAVGSAVGFAPETAGERARAARPQPAPPAMADADASAGLAPVEGKASVPKLAARQVPAPNGVSLVGSGAAAFRISHAPSTELLSAGLDVTARLTLDSEGRVVAVRLPPTAPDRVVLERFLKSLVLERVGRSEGSEVDVRVVKR